MVSTKENIQSKISEIEGPSYRSGQCRCIITDMRDVRGPVAAVQQKFCAWGYVGSVLEIPFVHEDMQQLPLGGDVGHYFLYLFYSIILQYISIILYISSINIHVSSIRHLNSINQGIIVTSLNELNFVIFKAFKFQFQ